MADGDRQPLLQDDEENADTPQQKIKNLYSSKSVLGRNNTSLENGDAVVNLTKNKAVTCLLEEDNLVAIFVVAFDTKAGNVVEWSLPEDADLVGVEFKAMASGSHTLHKDFVYFRKDNYFGLACFENLPVESQVERGARMKSIGILCTSYTTLYRHMHFLEKQVEKLLERPGHYGHLKAFWADKKGMLPMNASSQSIRSVSSTTSYSAQILPEMKITHPAGCFSQFVKFFGEQTFVLWKFALLGKRILFFSPPPIGIVCYRVYCACSLACHSLPTAFNVAEPRPHFYVNVADIDSLESEVSYVACTTEKIFETKPQLYDVYVDNQNVTTGQPVLRDLLKITAADRNKLQTLDNQRAQMEFSNEMADELSEEDMFISYFREQNNRLLQTLLDVSQSQERQVTSDLMRTMGLDPSDDRTFLMELVELYGIDVMLMVDNPCCPR